MALFSDVDWVIIAAVAGVLLFGRDNAQAMRTIGRWYGRAVRLKQELLDEFSRAADLPIAPGGTPSIRAALLAIDAPSVPTRGIPAPVARVAPAAPSMPPVPPASFPWTGGSLVPTWSMTVPVAVPGTEERP